MDSNVGHTMWMKQTNWFYRHAIWARWSKCCRLGGVGRKLSKNNSIRWRFFFLSQECDCGREAFVMKGNNLLRYANKQSTVGDIIKEAVKERS